MDVPDTVTREEMRVVISKLWEMVPHHQAEHSPDYIWIRDIPEPWNTRFQKAHRGSTFTILGTAYIRDWSKFLCLIRPSDPYW